MSECPICKAANPDGKKFCADCGAQLAATGLISEPDLRARIKAVLKEELRDQKVIEVEIVESILDRVMRWAKYFALATAGPLGIVMVVFAWFGFTKTSDLRDIARNAETTITNNVERVNKLAPKIENIEAAGKDLEGKVQIAQKDAENAQNAAKQSASKMQQWVDEQQNAIKQTIVRIMGRNFSPDSGDMSSVGDSLFNLAGTAKGLQGNLDALEKRLSILEMSRLVPVETFDILTRTLRARQSSSPVPVDEDPSNARPSYDLWFSLCVKNGDKCEEHGLDAVEKVIYHLDPKWFSNARETRSNRADQFGFSTRVWGITKVTACIYLKGLPTQPIVRAGFMNLTEPQEWGADLRVTPYECAA